MPDPNDTVTPMTKVEVSDSKFSLPIIPPTTVTVPINLTPIVPSVPTVTFSPGNIDIVVPPVNTTQVSLDVLKKLCGTEAGRALVDAFNSGSRTVRQVSSNELSSNLQAAIKGTAGTSDEAAGVIYLFPDNMSGLVDYFGSNYNYSGSITDFTASTLVHENLHFNNPPMPGVSAGQEGRYEEAWVRQVTDTKLPSYGLPTIFGFNTFSQYLDTVKPTGTDLGTGRPTSDYGQKAPASVVSQLNAASSKLSGWDCSKVKK